MTIDRAIEILDPEHREHYDGMDEVNEACRMGMEALERTKWIPCSERPPEELEPVNVVWVNHNPAPYYRYTKDVPQKAKAGKEALLLPLIPEAMMQLGPVITIPYANPNMEELGYAFDPVVNDSNGFMLESHGALVCSPKGVLYAIESLQVMESLAESIIVGRIMSKKLKCLTREDAEGIDGVIHELGWALPGAPGRYKTITEMFYH